MSNIERINPVKHLEYSLPLYQTLLQTKGWNHEVITLRTNSGRCLPSQIRVKLVIRDNLKSEDICSLHGQYVYHWRTEKRGHQSTSQL